MTHPPPTLVQPLFDGPLDLVGDIHGEINALRDLMGHLGYDPDGRHPTGRRLVFVGDLVDRGPDTPEVLRVVKNMVDAGRAQAILGNHELSLLRQRHRTYNHWMFPGGDLSHPARQDLQVLPEAEQGWVLDFVRSMPVALERHDLRVVHAAWDDDSVDVLRRHKDVLALFQHEEARVEKELERGGVTDQSDRNLMHQNENPVKLITSGPEQRGDQAFEVEGRQRWERRTPWWNHYAGDAFVVFGHYSKTSAKTQNGGLGTPLFPADPYVPVNNTFSVDFSVGSRAKQRRGGEMDPASSLVALRWPDREVMHDDGRAEPLKGDAVKAHVSTALDGSTA